MGCTAMLVFDTRALNFHFAASSSYFPLVPAVLAPGFRTSVAHATSSEEDQWKEKATFNICSLFFIFISATALG